MRKNKAIEAIYPLSPLQRGILFHSLYTPESGLYFEQAMLLIEGNLNPAAFEQAWQEVAARRDVLRALFVWEGQEKPLQVIVKQAQLPVRQEDWRNSTDDQRQRQLEEFLENDRHLGFDLTKPPLARLNLFRVEDNKYEFVWSFHHLLLDGWSMWLILSEVFTCYEALNNGQLIRLEKGRPYQDYVSWLQKQDLSKAESYWRQTLKGFRAPTRLGMERALKLSDGGDRHEQELWMSEETTSQLQLLSRKNKLTLSTIIQGAWALMLSRYSGESDVVYGAIVSGRPATLPGVQAIAGLFINTLPMRAKLPWHESTLEWLRAFQDQTAELSQYEYSPLVDVQGWSEIPRGAQLFDTLFAIQNYPMDTSSLGSGEGLKVHFIRAVEKANYPITALVMPGARLMLKTIYDSRRFDADAIRRMHESVETLLEGMVASMESRLSELPFLPASERNQLLTEWNDTQVAYPNRRGLHDLFEEQVERDPDAVALVWRDQRLSYGELNRRANQMAHYLRSLGVGPEIIVGVCVTRSIEMVVGLLGILKAGGAYLPLDPASPKERLHSILKDAGVSLVLTDERLHFLLLDFHGKIVHLGHDRNAMSQKAEQNPPCWIKAENLAFITYTADATSGPERPKKTEDLTGPGGPTGIAFEHRSAIAVLIWAGQTFNQSQLAGVLASTAIHHNRSFFELFVPLSFGGKVVITENLSHQPVPSSVMEVTLISATPSAMAELLETMGMPTNVRSVNLTGESLTSKLAQQIYENEAVETLYNSYGLSEGAICATCAPIKPADRAIPVIGRPIANARIYLFDSNMQTVPVGVAGEIFIAGESLVRGYTNRPALTAERFPPDPFGCGRLHKTRDLGRYLSDGNIVFLGRIERQAQILGYRIDVAEIEETLNRHPAARKAVVTSQRGEEGSDCRLVAYIVANPGQSVHTGELEDYLRERLPEHMIPSAYVTLDRLPAADNDKLDRQALPDPDHLKLKQQEGYMAPRTKVEKIVAEIWAEVLGLGQISVHDNFFELGGHSLLVMRVSSRIYKAFKVDLSLQDFFKAPTVADLGMTIMLRRVESEDDEKVRQALAGLE